MEAGVARLDSSAISALSTALRELIDVVLERDEEFIDTLSEGAQSDFVVPLQLSTRLFKTDDYTPMELVAAASTVRYCANGHLAEFPEGLVELLMELPE